MNKKDKHEQVYVEENELTAPSRRDFLKQIGSGVIILFTVGPSNLLAFQRRGVSYPDDFNAYLIIKEDGRVDCFTGKVELGQGVITSLAQILAEELDVPFQNVDMVMGDTALCPWDMGTFGSMSIKYFSPALKAAAAEARAILTHLASEQLGLPADRLITRDGFVLDKNNQNNKVSYALLTKGKKIERRLDGEPSLKPASQYTVSGKPIGRTDALEKVTGGAKYAGDIKLDGMMHARILRPPAHGAQFKSADTSAAERIPGVKIIRDKDLIAALHSDFDVADRALASIKAHFDIPEGTLDRNSIFEHLLKAAPEGNIIDQRGNLEEGKKLASRTFEETYLQGYVAHSPIEPHTAVAQVEGGKATVWASTQRPFGVQTEVAQALGIAAENVRVFTPFVGGGFGGKNRNQQAVEAARLAKLAGKPVQVAWSRREEFFFDTFLPAAVIKIASGMNDSNQMVFWDYHVYFAGGRSSQVFYDIPHFAVNELGGWMRATPGAHPFDTGAWRAPGSNTNTFARESHIDAMAAEVGMDPLEFRLLNLKDERMIRILKAAADKFGYTPAGSPSGRGYGISCLDYNGTYVAAVAEVEVDKGTGEISVNRVVCAQDMGQVINPDGAKSQIEGCITMGLGYSLSEEIYFRGGEIFTRNFDTYELPRFSRTPGIETILIDNPDMPPQGGGEPAIANMGAVVANAVHDAVGIRLRRLPLTPERVKEGILQS